MTALLDSPPCAPVREEVELTGELPVLVVDDAAIDRRFAANIVQKITGLRVLFANDGKEALAVLGREPVGLVLTDLQMPRMDGLELAEEIRCNYPLIPVVLMTAAGSERLALQALQGGASGYAPKQDLEYQLREALPRVLAAAKQNRRRQQFLECVTHMETEFELPNDPDVVSPVVSHLQDYLMRMKLCDLNNKLRVGVALEESLVNGMYHGNLEVSSELRRDGGKAFHDLIAQRRRLTPYEERRLRIRAQFSSSAATFVIRDEGPGFNVAALPDPTDPENLIQPSGRGLLLIRTFMDEVLFNDRGNEITLVKRKVVPK